MLLSKSTEDNAYIDETNSDCIRFSRTCQCYESLLMSCT
nr:MAG TPA: hypothetical protein [Caudoviricetes sp.]